MFDHKGEQALEEITRLKTDLLLNHVIMGVITDPPNRIQNVMDSHVSLSQQKRITDRLDALEMKQKAMFELLGIEEVNPSQEHSLKRGKKTVPIKK